MDRLYAPWRSMYAASVAREKHEDTTPDECVFCLHVRDKEQDEKHLVLRRFAHCFVMLNLYPYNAGHLLIVPYAHEGQLSGLSLEARHELIELTMQSSQILRDQLNAQGINIGMNLGLAAGAGIPSHLHQHVLPRWQGDTNFLATLADTKQISFDLHELYQKLRPAFEKIEIALC